MVFRPRMCSAGLMKVASVALTCAALMSAQTQLRSLRRVPVPEPPTLNDFVRDRTQLIKLGKAFFWDMQAGSDGLTACATCHFHAGADHRPRNTIVNPQQSFRVNATLTPDMFPLRALSDPTNRNSSVLRDSGVRIGSAGTFRRIFDGIVLGQAAELGHDQLDKPDFVSEGVQVRRVTVRNTPSVFNTAYYVRNFWDGRAGRTFDGFTVTAGVNVDEPPAPGILVVRAVPTTEGTLARERVAMDKASLAAQAVGPALDHLEMSYAGRTWPLLGKKLLSLPPLARQRVAVDDSVLGAMAPATGPGLLPEHTYRRMIEAAFLPRLWESRQLVDAQGAPLEGRFDTPETLSEFTQAEYNFSLFWGLALQAYQSTLNSDATPFDRFMEGDQQALTAQQQEGLRLFDSNAVRCSQCHSGAEFSGAAFNDNGTTRGDSFERTGVRPQSEDNGAGNATFKSIGLRNVEFTGPYFHNGGQATLEQVVDFYRRGGDFSPTANEVQPLRLTNEQAAALVEFLKALSDDRVRYERAPFDHPEVCVPVGHEEDPQGILRPGPIPTSATEIWRLIPASGTGGNAAPLRTFEELLRGLGANGERTHALTEPCPALP